MNMLKLLALALSGSSSKMWSLKEDKIGKSKKHNKSYGKNK